MNLPALRTSAALALVLGLSGCNTTDVGNTLSNVGSSIAGGFESLTSGEFFSDGYLSSRSDACYGQRQAMAEHGSFFDKRLVVATAGGAAVGGLIAALRGDNVLEGVLIGGAVGLAGGYLLKMQQDGLAPDSIIGRAFGDVQAENRKIDNLLASFRSLKSCRRDQGSAIQAAYNAKTIDKATAQEQMASVRGLYNEDVAKFRQIADQIAENTESYAAVYNEVAADNRAGSLEVKEYRKGRRSARVSRKRPKKQAGTADGSLRTNNRKNVDKLQDECLTNVRKRDECIEEIQQAESGGDGLELDLT